MTTCTWLGQGQVGGDKDTSEMAQGSRIGFSIPGRVLEWPGLSGVKFPGGNFSSVSQLRTEMQEWKELGQCPHPGARAKMGCVGIQRGKERKRPDRRAGCAWESRASVLQRGDNTELLLHGERESAGIKISLGNTRE